jgi:hypothetical protein
MFQMVYLMIFSMMEMEQLQSFGITDHHLLQKVFMEI